MASSGSNCTNSLSQVEFPTHSRNPDLKRLSQEKYKAVTSDPDPVNQQILKHIVDMGNTVLSKRAAADLHRLVLCTRSITVTNTKFINPQHEVQTARSIPPTPPVPQDSRYPRKSSFPLACSAICP